MIELGEIGFDKITGFTGLCMAKAQYLTGCNQVMLTPQKLNEKGERIESQWFDEVRVSGTNRFVDLFDEAKQEQIKATNPGRDENLPPTY